MGFSILQPTAFGSTDLKSTQILHVNRKENNKAFDYNDKCPFPGPWHTTNITTPISARSTVRGSLSLPLLRQARQSCD